MTQPTPPHVTAWLTQAATDTRPATPDDPDQLRARIRTDAERTKAAQDAGHRLDAQAIVTDDAVEAAAQRSVSPRAWQAMDAAQRTSLLDSTRQRMILAAYPALADELADARRLAAAIDRADSVRIDRDNGIWRPVNGGWKTASSSQPLPLDRLEELFGPTRAVLLVDIDPDDQDEPTTAERLATTAQAARDTADALARTEAERDQARANLLRARKTTERVRDERDHARHRAAVHADTLLHIHTALDALPDGPQLRSRIRNLIAAGRDAVDAGPTFAGLGSPTGRAQVQSAAAELLQHLRATEPLRPADWERKAVAAAADALGEKVWGWSDGSVMPARLAEVAVRAIIDAGLAGPGGRCTTCQATYPRTPAPDSDGRCWTCATADQGGVDEQAEGCDVCHGDPAACGHLQDDDEWPDDHDPDATPDGCRPVETITPTGGVL